MTNNSLDKGFHVVKLSITTLVLDFVSLELVVVQERFQQLTGVHSILEGQDCVHFTVRLEKWNILICEVSRFGQLCFWEKGGEGDTAGQGLGVVKGAIERKGCTLGEASDNNSIAGNPSPPLHLTR